MVEQLRDLGYRVGWAHGATPPDLREKHREAGWAWEGDTHVDHHVHVAHVDGEPVTGSVPIQHFDAEAPGYVPEHRVLRDDSHEPTVWFVEGPAKDGVAGEPTGYTYEDGTDVGVLVQGYVREDDTETWQSLVDTHAERVRDLELRADETPEATSERHRLEAEERAAEDA